MATLLDTADLVRDLVAKRGEFLAFVERRVGDRAQAEDILQDAFAKSIERLGELNDREAATAWFYRVLRNAVIDGYRRHDRRARALSLAELEAANAPDEPLPDSVATSCACVGDLVDTLKPEYATALTRIEIDGLAVKEFALEQGISANNAAVRVHRARKALARELVECCGGCASLGCGDCTCLEGAFAKPPRSKGGAPSTHPKRSPVGS